MNNEEFGEAVELIVERTDFNKNLDKCLNLVDLQQRIDKTLDFINAWKNNKTDLKVSMLDLLQIEDILRGKDNENKKIEKLNEHYYHDEPALIDDMAHKINEIIDKINLED